MANFEVWKLTVDVLLSCSLLFLAFRFARGGNFKAQSKRGMELEGTLRRLIQDAEAAGKELNDELYKRQVSLEKALANIERAESGIQNVTVLADQKCKEIDGLLSRTRNVIADLKDQAPLADSIVREQQTEDMGQVYSRNRAQKYAIEEDSQRPANRVAPASVRAYASASKAASTSGKGSSQYDEYSSWLMDQAGSSTQGAHSNSAQDQSLRGAIEVEVQRENQGALAARPNNGGSSQSGSSSAALLREKLVEALKQSGKPAGPSNERVIEDMEAIYDRAEALIRSGRDVQSVSSQLNIPLRRAQAISDMVRRERDYGFDDPETSRLGALGNTKREDEFI